MRKTNYLSSYVSSQFPLHVHNPETLLRMAQEYLIISADAYSFWLDHRLQPDEVLCSRTSKHLTQHEAHRKKLEYAWDTLNTACEPININPIIVTNTAKAMNRYKKRHPQAYVKLPSGWNPYSHESYTDTIRRSWELLPGWWDEE